jgi:site-specific recombinase XerD
VQSKTITIDKINEGTISHFLIESDRKGAIRRGDKKSLHRFLDHLRIKGKIPYPDLAPNESPLISLRNRYEKYLIQERGLSPTTGGHYWFYIQKFLASQLIDKPDNFIKIEPRDIDQFILRYATEQTLKASQLMVSAMRSFFRFLFRFGKTECNFSAAVPSIPAWRLSEIPKYINSEDVQVILNTCDFTTPVGRRNHAILILIACLGLRSGEIVALELDDINWRASEIIIRGKGKYYDKLPLPQSIGEALVNYLKNDRPQCLTRRIFVKMRAPFQGFKHSSTVSTIVGRAVKKSGLNTPSKGAHLLRHSLATSMLNNGALVAEIGELLRHRSTNTTEIYAKTDIKGLRSIARVWPEKEVANE